jgi:hypothetical protein
VAGAAAVLVVAALFVCEAVDLADPLTTRFPASSSLGGTLALLDDSRR